MCTRAEGVEADGAASPSPRSRRSRRQPAAQPLPLYLDKLRNSGGPSVEQPPDQPDAAGQYWCRGRDAAPPPHGTSPPGADDTVLLVAAGSGPGRRRAAGPRLRRVPAGRDEVTVRPRRGRPVPLAGTLRTTTARRPPIDARSRGGPHFRNGSPRSPAPADPPGLVGRHRRTAPPPGTTPAAAPAVDPPREPLAAHRLVVVAPRSRGTAGTARRPGGRRNVSRYASPGRVTRWRAPVTSLARGRRRGGRRARPLGRDVSLDQRTEAPARLESSRQCPRARRGLARAHRRLERQDPHVAGDQAHLVEAPDHAPRPPPPPPSTPMPPARAVPSAPTASEPPRSTEARRR